MTVKRFPLDGVSRAEWLAIRRQFVNASEIGIVCGEAKWGSLATLYAEKKGLRPQLVDTAAFKKGRWGEASVFEALLDQYPEWEVKRAKIQVIDEDKRQACTPDGFARVPGRHGLGIVQAKVVSRGIFRQKWLDDVSDFHGPFTPPAAYRLQTLQEMRLNDCSWGVLAVLVNGEYDWDFRLYDIDRDPVLESRIDYCCAEFLRNYFDPGIMPPFDPSRDDLLVRQLYPRDTGTIIDLRHDNRAVVLVEELTEVQQGLARMRATEKAIKTEIEGKLGDNSFGLLPDGRCLSWKMQHRRSHTVAASDHRVLRVLKRVPEEAEETEDA